MESATAPVKSPATPSTSKTPLINPSLLHPVDDPADPKGHPNTSVSKNIYCQNSGVILGRLDICIFEGHLAYFEAHAESTYFHPFYRLSHLVLLKKLEESLHSAQEKGWALTWREQQRLQLLVSATMVNLGCLKQQLPTLPSIAIAAGSAGRLLGLAKWFFFLSSQRFEFPTYSVSKLNGNLQWENFSVWLDAAFNIRHQWTKNKRAIELDAKRKAQEIAIKELTDEAVYKKVDIRKIWSWIALQLELHYSPGRVETFKNLFLNGDLEAFYWTEDDVDDLSVALVEHCDCGNEIMFFIRKRLNGILGLIKDYRSSFTLINATQKEFQESEQTPQEALFIGEYDKKVEALDALPERPKRESFATMGLFLKAEAQWNILARRFKQLKGQ